MVTREQLVEKLSDTMDPENAKQMVKEFEEFLLAERPQPQEAPTWRLEQGWRDGGVMRSHAGDLKLAADKMRTLLAALNIAAKESTRLAALEHERDDLRAELTGTLSEAFQAVPACYDTPADHYREMARRLVEDRDVQKHRARHAEAALLSLQTAVRTLEQEWGKWRLNSCACPACSTVRTHANQLAALLPDTAGTKP